MFGFKKQSFEPMTQEQRQIQMQRVLNWVNAMRTEWGAQPLTELPKGEMGASDQCVIYNALNDARKLIGVSPASIVVHDQERDFPKITPPLFVSYFIEDFDHAKYPELVK